MTLRIGNCVGEAEKTAPDFGTYGSAERWPPSQWPHELQLCQVLRDVLKTQQVSGRHRGREENSEQEAQPRRKPCTRGGQREGPVTGVERTAVDGGSAGPAGSVGTRRGRTSNGKLPRCVSQEGAGRTGFTVVEVTLPTGREAGWKEAACVSAGL